MPTFGEMRVITAAYMTEEVKRLWTERLFSWPWKPWVKTKTVPSTKILIALDGTMIMHPATKAYLQQIGSMPKGM